MLDIVVPTYNQTDLTLLCFESITKNTREYRIIWVDNGSEEEHIKAVSDFLDNKNVPHQKILLHENLGFIKATNCGMAVSSAKYLCLLNNDTEVTPNWAAKMIDSLVKNKELALVGPVSSATGSWQGVDHIEQFVKQVMPAGYNLPPDEYNAILENSAHAGRTPTMARMLAFFCVIMPRWVIKEIGFLDERFGVGFGDDDDYCKRVLHAGFKLGIRLDTYIYHAHRSTFKSVYEEKQIKVMQNQNMEILNLKWKLIDG